MQRLLVFAFIVALVAVTLLGSARPAAASDYDTGYYCSWIKGQAPWVARVGYNVACDRVAPVVIVPAVGDPRGNVYRNDNLPGTLGVWAAGGK